MPLSVEALEDTLRERRCRARLRFIAGRLLALAADRSVNPRSEAARLAEALWEAAG